MRWEDAELIIILSKDRCRLKVGRSCQVCGWDIEAGEKVLSLGVIDRLERCKARWFICSACEDLFLYSSMEDAPGYVQEWHEGQRLVNEIWRKS